MRLVNLIPTLLLSLPIIFPTAVLARPRRSGLKSSKPDSLVFHRQPRPHRLPQRDLIDICVNLDTLIDGDALLQPLFANLHLCLCLKDLDLFLDSFVELDILGIQSEVKAKLDQAFHHQPACDPLPAHARRSCTPEEPCACACNSGFTKVHGECVCPLPKSVCNGVCGHFPHGCGGYPSSVPRSLKKRAAEQLTFADAQALCGDKRVCGVSPQSGSERSFECVDIKTTSESCGGCLYAHPWAQSNPQTTLTTVRGQDCTTLQSPQALGHRCEIGRCIIDTCTKGYIPTKDGSACVPSSRIVPRTLSATGLAGPHTPGPASVPRRGLTPARSGSDIVVTVPGVANADLNLGDGLNNLVNDLSGDLGLGSLIHTGNLVESRSEDEEDCGCDNGQGQTTGTPTASQPASSPWSRPTRSPSSSSSGYGYEPSSSSPDGSWPSSTSTPGTGAGSNPSSGSCPSTSSGISSSPSSVSGSDIVVTVPGIANADLNLGDGLNNLVNGLAGDLGLGSLIHPGNLVEGKRSQPADGCDGEDGNGSASGSNSGNGNGSYGSGSTPTHPPPPPPSPSPSSGADEPCPDDGTVSGDPSANSGDIVVSVPGITNTDLNLGPGLNNLVNGLSGDLGLGSLIHPGHLVEGRSEDEEDCGCEDGQGSATGTSTPTSSPSSSGSGYQPSSSSPGYGSQPSSSSSGAGTGTGSCSSQSSGTSSSSSSGSGSDIVITVPGIANADLNLGDGLNNLVDGLAGGLGLGSLIHPGHLVESKRSQPADGCDGEDGSGSASGSNSGNGNGSYGSGSTPTHPPSPPPSPSPSSGADEPCPDDGTTSDDPPASSGDIVVTVPGITNTDLNLGPGLNNLVNGLSGDLGLGSLIHPGRLVEGRSEDEEDCGCEDGQGSATGTPTPTSSPSSSGSGYQPPSSPGYGSQPSSSPGAGASTCPSKPSSSGAQSSTGNNFSEKDIVLSVPGLTNSDLNLGPGLNNLVTGLAGELGLGSLAHPGQLVGGRS